MNELIETAEYLSLLINIELVEGVEVNVSNIELLTRLKLLTKVRNQIDELTTIIITQELNNIRESV
jgi:hypothetical protein